MGGAEIHVVQLLNTNLITLCTVLELKREHTCNLIYPHVISLAKNGQYLFRKAQK